LASCVPSLSRFATSTTSSSHLPVAAIRKGS
jgi:hypothetical protein